MDTGISKVDVNITVTRRPADPVCVGESTPFGVISIGLDSVWTDSKYCRHYERNRQNCGAQPFGHPVSVAQRRTGVKVSSYGFRVARTFRTQCGRWAADAASDCIPFDPSTRWLWPPRFAASLCLTRPACTWRSMSAIPCCGKPKPPGALTTRSWSCRPAPDSRSHQTRGASGRDSRRRRATSTSMTLPTSAGPEAADLAGRRADNTDEEIAVVNNYDTAINAGKSRAICDDRRASPPTNSLNRFVRQGRTFRSA